MITALQLLINAIALGAAYALVALGFVLVLNATAAVNFAQGDMVMAGGYVAIALAGALPVPGILLLPLVLVLMAVLGLVVAALAYLPLAARPPAAVFISTIAIGIVLENGINLLFGAAPRATPSLLGTGQLTWGGLAVSLQSLAIVAVAALLIAGQSFVMARTQFGRMLRATAQDRETARALGIRVTAMIAASFAIGAALAGAAGLLLANQFFVTPSAGTDFVIKAYIATTIGGWGSLAGSVAGAFLIAVFEVGVSSVFSYTVATAALYAALLAILLLRPQGLFGEAAQTRA
ncbi:MAG TPA: branched-chain amino acid ABC transporter permease [Stellaceae bacterium]|nr:branched-chain amino acid ABC transporter permease [Stellaceae bacterium]